MRIIFFRGVKVSIFFFSNIFSFFLKYPSSYNLINHSSGEWRRQINCRIMGSR
jgi:hypothetical protein